MSLTDIIKKFSGSIRKTVTAGALLAAGMAGTAHADGFNDRERKEPGLWDAPKIVIDGWDGYLRAGAHQTPTERGVGLRGGLIARIKDWRPSLHLRSGLYEFEAIGEDSRVDNYRATVGIGGLLLNHADKEVFLNFLAGPDYSIFKQQVEGDATRGICGAQLGFASQKAGIRALASLNLGSGKYNMKFPSGFEMEEENYRTGHLSLEFSKRLWSDSITRPIKRENFGAEEIEEIANGVYFAGWAHVKSDEYEGLQRGRGAGLQVAMPIVLYLKKPVFDEDGKITEPALICRIIPKGWLEQYRIEGDSEVSFDREITTTRGGPAINVQLEIARLNGASFGISGEFGWEWSERKTRDVGQNIDSRKLQNGERIAISAYLNF